jgi:DNA-nicking Smr family endonuclease
VSKDIRLQDQALWDDVRRTVKPLGAKARTRMAQEPLGVHGVRRDSTKNTGVSITTAHLNPATLRRKAAPVAAAVPPLQALDRRTAQRLGRGQIEPDAHIDLHGDSLEAARMKLVHFIARQRHEGARFVLVITGKGASPYARHTLHGLGHFHAPEREGRLRREVPRWLAEDQFRQHVVGFQPSHPRHGGGGAFYLRLRKRSDQP